MTTLEALHKYLDAADVCPETIEAVAKISGVREFAAGDIVFHANQASDHLFIVLSGQVDVQYLMGSGKRQTFDHCRASDFLCWSAVVRPHQTSSIGIARAKTEVLAIDGPALRQLSEKDPHFGYHLQAQMARVIRRRLQAARKQIAELE